LKTWQSHIVKLTPLWLILLAPPLIFPDPIRALALLGLPFLWIAQKREKGYFIRRTPFDWAILIILLMVLVSLYATFDIRFSLAKLTGLLLHIAIFYAAVEAGQTRSGLNRSLALYFFLGLGVAAAGLVGTEWLYKNPLLSNLTHRLPLLIRGLPGAEAGFGPNQVAGTLLWVFPLELSLLWEFKNRQHPDELLFKGRLFLSIAFVITGFTFLLAQSRGGWFGGLVAIMFLGAVLNKQIRWLVSIGVVIFVIGGGFVGWPNVINFLTSSSIEATVGSFGTINFRLEVWRASLWAAADFPFTGIGLGTFRKVIPILYPVNVPPTLEIPHAHNLFLHMVLDLGFIGMIAYLALWIGAGYMVMQVIQHTRDHFIRAVALGVGSSLVGFFVYGLTDTVALGAKPGFFWWWLLAFSLGTYQHAPELNG